MGERLFVSLLRCIRAVRAVPDWRLPEAELGAVMFAMREASSFPHRKALEPSVSPPRHL